MTIGALRVPGLEVAAATMPFDQFGRYHMLREAVDACRLALNRPRLRILDVGGYFLTQAGEPTLPLTRFLPDDEIHVVDMLECNLPGYSQGDGTALGFEDQEWDLVVSADTLEHIPGTRRAVFWRELLRVARDGVILLAPFGTPAVTMAEDVLFHYIKADLQVEQIQLREHREYVLPVLADWLQFLANAGYTARAYPTGYVHAWLGMMLFKHMLIRIDADIPTQRLPDAYYNLCFFPTERRNPAYRQLIMVEKTAGLSDAVDAVLAPTVLPDQEGASAEWGQAVGPTMMAILERQLWQQHNQSGQSQHGLDQALQHLRALERVIDGQQSLLHQMQSQALVADAQANMHIAQRESIIRDLTERAQWLEGQNNQLRRLLDALQNGRLMRLLHLLH